MKTKALLWQVKVTAITIGGFFISCSFIVFILPLLVIFGILSWGIYGLLKIQYGDTITRAGGLDIMQAIESKASQPYINAIARYEGHFTIDALKELMMRKGIRYRDANGHRPFRRYQQRLEKHCGYHVFRDDPTFNIDNHVKLITKEELFEDDKRLMQFDFLAAHPRRENVTNFVKSHYGVDDEWQIVLQKIMKKFGARPVSARGPRWEILFFPESSTRTTILFRINHGITDGIYFLRFLLESLGDKAVKYRLPYNYHQPNFMKSLMEGFLAFCLVPFGIFRILRICSMVGKNPLHGPKLTGKKIYLVSKSFALEDLKEMKTLSKVSVNTLLFSGLSYALRCHYRRKKASIPYTLVIVPISLQDLSQPITTKNSFGLQGMAIPTAEIDPEADCALFRLKTVNKMINRSKRDPSFLPIHWMIKYISSLLPSVMVKSLFTSTGLTATVSNVAGPQDDSLYVCGNEQIDMAFWVPDRSPMGMGVSVTGHKGKVRLGIMIDTALIATEEEAYNFLDDYLTELKTIRKELHLHNS